MKPNAKSVVTALRKVWQIRHALAHSPSPLLWTSMYPKTHLDPVACAGCSAVWQVPFPPALIKAPTDSVASDAHNGTVAVTQLHCVVIRLLRQSFLLPAPPPFLPQVSDLQYNTIANGHGPIIRYNVEALVDDYKTWSLAVEKGQVQVRCVNTCT
jgi:hypothetical protein